MNKLQVLSLALLTIGGVATANENELLPTPTSALSGSHDGAAVAWGGLVVSRDDDEADKGCIGVIGYPIDRHTGRPTTTKTPGALFYACSESLDAQNFGKGRAIVVAGTLSSVRDRIVASSCNGLPVLPAHASFDGTALQSTPKGCLAQVPVVAVSDARSWPDLADRTPYIGPSQSSGGFTPPNH